MTGRSFLWAVVSVLLIGGLSSVGCGSSGTNRGDNGGNTDAGASGGTAGSGGAGGTTAGSGGSVNAVTDASTVTDAATDAGDAAIDASTTTDASDAAIDASAMTDASDAAIDASTTTDASDAAPAPPPIDAGIDCTPPPSNEAPLVPATEGVPAAGLALWLRGDRGIYMRPGNGAVCAWADQSGHHGVLTSTGVRPTWTAAGLGDKPAVHWAATAAALATGGVLGIGATSGRTYVAVQQLVTTNHRFDAIIQGQVGTAGTYLAIDTNAFDTAGSLEGVYATNNAYDSALATSTAPRIHVYTLSTMIPGTPVLSAIDYRVNGATQTLTRTPGGLGNGNLEDFSNANFTAVGADGAEAFIAEILVYDRALTTDEKTALETALETRYGIQ